MLGVDLNRPVFFRFSSLRFFRAGEHHIDRVCEDDVLLLVYEGVLRFDEDGVSREVGPGEYYIQRHGLTQRGIEPSDAPKYLYIHFSAEWREEAPSVLPFRGSFDYAGLRQTLEETDRISHDGEAPLLLKTAKLYEILSALYSPPPADSVAGKMARFLAGRCAEPFSLDLLCREFHFCKNHVIHLFQKEFGMTPVRYMNLLRLKEAEYRMEVTSDSLESIALRCGFPSYSHFYKLFLRKNGLSPEAWREERRIGKRTLRE